MVTVGTMSPLSAPSGATQPSAVEPSRVTKSVAALAVTVKPAKADADIAAAQSNEISFLLFISSLPFFP